MTGGEAVATVHTAAAEVGQGLVTVEQQICRTELGVERVVVHPKDTAVGSGGSTSASRQTYVTGGAVKAACEAVRAAVLDAPAACARRRARTSGWTARRSSAPPARCSPGWPRCSGTTPSRRPSSGGTGPTHAIDPETGQGDAHVQFAFSAHRAVVDVDVELGLVKVVALDTAQDVGKAINPDAVVGQIHGGSAQGMGLALMEEIVVTDGHVRNPSFTDYLIPTILDMPPMQVTVLEYADPHAPYGVRGVGEPPTISSGPAVAAAIRAATGKPLRRVPIRRSTSPAPDPVDRFAGRHRLDGERPHPGRRARAGVGRTSLPTREAGRSERDRPAGRSSPSTEPLEATMNTRSLPTCSPGSPAACASPN